MCILRDDKAFEPSPYVVLGRCKRLTRHQCRDCKQYGECKLHGTLLSMGTRQQGRLKKHHLLHFAFLDLKCHDTGVECSDDAEAVDEIPVARVT